MHAAVVRTVIRASRPGNAGVMLLSQHCMREVELDTCPLLVTPDSVTCCSWFGLVCFSAAGAPGHLLGNGATTSPAYLTASRSTTPWDSGLDRWWAIALKLPA